MHRQTTVTCGRTGPIGGPANARTSRIAVIALLASIAVFAAESLPGRAAEPAPAAAAPAAAAAPTVEEWLNQNVRLRETVQALDRPSADGKPSGEIRAGAEVKAIGLMAGKRWVRIELPDHSLAYVPRGAIAFESGAAASTPAGPGAATGAENGTPLTTLPLTTAPPSGAPPSGAPPSATFAAVPGAVRGPVTRVPNAATLVVNDQRIRLSGIDPGPQAALAPFESWVRGQGALTCEPDAQTGRYHCFTGDRVDVAEAAILNGAGRVGDGATPAYRDSETAARQAQRGLWAQP